MRIRDKAILILSYILSGSIFFTLNTAVTEVRYLSFFLLFLIFCAFATQRRFTYDETLFLLWLFLITFSIFLRGLTGYFENISLFSSMVFGLYLAKKYDAQSLIKIFVNVMVIIVAITLVAYVVNNWIVSLNGILPQKTNANGITYSVGYVYNYLTAEPIRNCGPFWEPGIFASWIVLAILFLGNKELFPNRRIPLVILVLGVLSTYSAAGYLVLFVVLLLRLVYNTNQMQSQQMKIFAHMLILIMLGVFVYFVYPIISVLFEENKYLTQLVGESFWNSSRIFSIKQNFDLFVLEPIWGHGQAYVVANTINVGNTASSIYLLACFGILGVSYTVGIVFGIMRQKGLTIMEKILILVIILVLVNKEPHYEFVWMWALIFMMLRNRNIFERREVTE